MNMKRSRKDNIPRIVEIGHRLRELRDLSDVPLDVLTKKVGISAAGWRNWESGYATPPWDKLVLIAEVFDTTVDYILGRNARSGVSFIAARQRWGEFACPVFVKQSGAVELILDFTVDIERIGNYPICRDQFDPAVTVRGRRSLHFKSKDEFVKFTNAVLSKARDFCIAEALSHA